MPSLTPEDRAKAKKDEDGAVHYELRLFKQQNRKVVGSTKPRNPRHFDNIIGGRTRVSYVHLY